jgi:hypothetical protein
VDLNEQEANGFKTYRFSSHPIERKLTEEWIQYSKAYSIYAHLFSSEPNKADGNPSPEQVFAINRIIQWLGTFAGLSFLKKVFVMKNPCENCLVLPCCSKICYKRSLWNDVKLIRDEIFEVKDA